MFTKEEREIFEYSDGSRTIKADPSVIDRAFRAAMGERNIEETFTNALYNVEDLDEILRVPYERDFVVPAVEALIEAARAAFRVEVLDDEGNGLTESETLKLLFSYTDWKEEKKGQAATSPSSSSLTDGQVADRAMDPTIEGSTTEPTTD